MAATANPKSEPECANAAAGRKHPAEFWRVLGLNVNL